MPQYFVPLEGCRFIEKQVIQTTEAGPYRYKIKVPSFLGTWDVWEYWERERFISMEQNLHPGDVLFDIGAEKGWQTAIYAQFVGGENMVLVEPMPLVWPNIKAIWEANGLAKPLATYCGLFGHETGTPEHPSFVLGSRDGWPEVAFSDQLFIATGYRYLHEHTHETPQTRLDDFVQDREIIPNGITMDCEGAEIRILQGAVETMKKHRPLVWASLHEDTALRNYNSPLQEIHDLMASLGYIGTHLATDHEAHWFWKPGEKP